MRGVVSLTGQLASVDEDLTGRENLILLGRLLGLKRPEAKVRADELLDAFGLKEASARLVKNYSGGMRRRLDIAASLVVTPQVMFLDEPTTGSTRARATRSGTSSAHSRRRHDDPALHPVPRGGRPAREGIAVIDRGKVIAEGTPAQLKASVGSAALHVRLLDPEKRPEAERILAGSWSRCTSSPIPPPCRRPAPTPTAPPRPSARSAAPGIGVAGFSLASRASTRSSWP